MFLLALLFWLCVGGMLLSYLVYPLLVRTAALGCRPPVYARPDSWPPVEVLFAAYNEEAVIEEKIRSVLGGAYPPECITLRVGSDCSSDRTNYILRKLAEEFPQVKPVFFETRQGKSAIINQLVAQSRGPYLLLTDANIIFTEHTITELVQILHNEPNTAAAGGHIRYFNPTRQGIAPQESIYLEWENRLKAAESRLWSLCMGLEGGIYLIRRSLMPTIPPHTFMEDFYVTLQLLQNGQALRLAPGAVVWEDVSTQAQEEYRRKVRISIGNFQNLASFGRLLWQRFWPVGFSFLAHKVLRWGTPFFLLFSFFCALALFKVQALYALYAGFFTLLIALGVLGILFSRQRYLRWLNFPGHFLYMNIALLDGFFTYLKGIDSNVWQPTKRKQS